MRRGSVLLSPAVWALFVSLLLTRNGAAAATVSQAVTLHPGWNAVFLEVQPGLNPSPPAGCAPAADRTLPEPCEVFGSVPGILSIWAWNPRTSTVEFIQNPAQMMPKPTYMLSWFPGQPLATNLHAVTGETAYLIHRDESSPGDVALTITGEPTLPRVKWVPNSFNFVGFHLDRSVTPGPFFSSFFSGSSALDGQEMYVLRGNAWARVQSSDRMAPGEAFWAYCKGSAEFTGPIALRLARSEGFHLGARLEEESIGLASVAATAKTISIRVSSAAPQLHWWHQDKDAGIAEWVDLFGAPPAGLTLPAGGTREVLLGVKRAGLAAGVVYGANLEVSDGEGLRYVIPASVVGVGSEGLWVGDAIIRKVSQPALPAESHPETPRPTGSEFSFRLIILKEAGRALLLREVVQLWQPGATPQENGHFVLVGNESRLGEFEGSALRDGRPVGRRISSAAFGFSGYKEFSGTFAAGGTLTVSIPLPADDPTNPFRHLYHPDHRLPEQSYNVDRAISLTFSDRDGDGIPLPGAPLLGWGSSEVGGVYGETMSFDKDGPAGGDVPYVVKIEGTFLLRRVSDIARLEF